MKLKLKAFSQLIEDMGATLQSSATNLVDVSVGSVVRAIFEANASVVLWLQWLILQVLQTTRASTSTGVDLDSWMQDFGLLRLPAISSSGVVMFSRFVSDFATIIPVGATVKTSDGSLSFSVTEDQSLSIWQTNPSGYLLPNGVSSIELPVTCVTGGSIGNVLDGTVSIIATPLPGVDRVTNAAAFSNGADAESDQSFRSRFLNYLASRSRATPTAVRSAIADVRQGLDIEILENTGVDGISRSGFFVVIVDDGSGYPSTDLLASITDAIDLVRPVGTMFAVIPPNVISVDVSLTATLTTGTNRGGSVSSIQQQVVNYLDGLAIGRIAAVTRIAQAAYKANPGIENITGILLNGASSDIVPAQGCVIKAGHILVTTNDG